jgi:HEPN domain-containing protein
MYYLLTEDFKQQETKLAAIITNQLPVEKIYLLGSSLSQQRTETAFMTDAPSCRKVSHYYLLVLVHKNCNYSNNEVQDRIENTCRSFIPVTAIVLHTQQFTNWLNAGHRFAITVVKIAVLIHDGNKIPFTIPPGFEIKGSSAKADKSLHSHEHIMANEFIAGAELYLARKQHNMTLFMLHQAAEHALHLLLKNSTGLQINTHNIEKLLRYCSMVSFTIPGIFDRKNEKEENLLRLLQQSYIGTRYRQMKAVSKENLVMLFERVKKLVLISGTVGM